MDALGCEEVEHKEEAVADEITLEQDIDLALETLASAEAVPGEIDWLASDKPAGIADPGSEDDEDEDSEDGGEEPDGEEEE
jgi:hypothetical protein